MDLPGPIHDFLLVFLGSGLILGGLGVVLFTNPVFSTMELLMNFVLEPTFLVFIGSRFLLFSFFYE